MNDSETLLRVPVREHDGAMFLLLGVALGDVFEIDDDGVWMRIPNRNERAEIPVPLTLLDAVEYAGYLVHREDGSHCTEKGMAALRRWSRRHFREAEWKAVERRMKPPVWS